MSPAGVVPHIAAYDDTASGPVGDGFRQGVDQRSLQQEVLARNPNRKHKHPFRVFCERVVHESGVPDAQETRQMASHVCGEVARLPFVPDSETKVKVKGSPNQMTTEFEQQVEKTARRAEERLDSAMVWTASAMKLARTALELRQQDPDGSQRIAWVNDPLPGEDSPAAILPSAFTGEDDSDTGEDTV